MSEDISMDDIDGTTSNIVGHFGLELSVEERWGERFFLLRDPRTHRTREYRDAATVRAFVDGVVFMSERGRDALALR